MNMNNFETDATTKLQTLVLVKILRYVMIYIIYDKEKLSLKLYLKLKNVLFSYMFLNRIGRLNLFKLLDKCRI